MHIVVHTKLADIPALAWNSLLQDNNPFMRHEFLHGLEQSGCVSLETGWEPAHIALYLDETRDQLIGAMPCYIKHHSYGEYIFDWAWADAHHRHGIDYYPKLSNAVPFTPATGPRMLVAADSDVTQVQSALIDAAVALTEERKLSSFHSLFCAPSECASFSAQSMLIRHSTQFHWHNQEYASFDEFLARMSSKKRKNIRRERRRVSETGLQYRWCSGEELTADAVVSMHQFYLRTISMYGAQAYLNRDFFQFIADNFNQQTLFLFAEYEGHTVAGGLYFKSDNTLYGRYWGALNNFHSVHFETCYYQPIDWCIRHGYERFEAGAQGEHKLARGLEPATTYSAHWLSDPRFRHAIDEFVTSEQEHIAHYQRAMKDHSPFKSEV